MILTISYGLQHFRYSVLNFPIVFALRVSRLREFHISGPQTLNLFGCARGIHSLLKVNDLKEWVVLVLAKKNNSFIYLGARLFSALKTKVACLWWRIGWKFASLIWRKVVLMVLEDLHLKLDVQLVFIVWWQFPCLLDYTGPIFSSSIEGEAWCSNYNIKFLSQLVNIYEFFLTLITWIE